MEKQTVRVIVAGQANSGKSRISYIIKKALREHGIEVSHDVGLDYPSEQSYDVAMHETFDRSVPAIAARSRVELEDMQLVKSHRGVNADPYSFFGRRRDKDSRRPSVMFQSEDDGN